MGQSADEYRRFAEFEAHGISAIYEEWALGVASDEHVQSRIETLPRQKWQPNLVFASARWHGAPLSGYSDFREWLLHHWDEVAATAMARFTQTNEAGRCGVLLPELMRIEGPVALLEVGASAGMCLYPDRYSYRYRTPAGVHRIDPSAGQSSVVLDCEVLNEGALPAELPDVVWRAGIDLTPIDVTDADSLSWLETLVWPEQTERRARLRAAAEIVAADPPMLAAGDLNRELERVAGQAPSNATLVIFHSAVLAYLSDDERDAFVRQVKSLDAVWLSNESAGVLPEVRAQLPADIDARGSFILSRDGKPTALAGAHGQWYGSLGS